MSLLTMSVVVELSKEGSLVSVMGYSLGGAGWALSLKKVTDSVT